MSKRPPDFSFERGGRPLSDWLRELVSEEAPARLAAGEALQAMMVGLPNVHSDWSEIDWESDQDVAGQADRFKQALRAVAGAPSFPIADFVRQLIAYRIGLKDDWHRRVDEEYQREETGGVYEERLVRRIEAAEDDAEREEATRRYLRWV